MIKLNTYTFRVINNLATNKIVNAIFAFSASKLIYIFLASTILIYFIKKPISKVTSNQKIFFYALFSSILGLFFNFIAGKFYYEARPFVALSNVHKLIYHSIDNSFPSDHAAISFAIAMLIYMYNKKIGIIFITSATLISFARVFSGVHYPLDIIVGTILGVISAVIIYISKEKLEKLIQILIRFAKIFRL